VHLIYFEIAARKHINLGLHQHLLLTNDLIVFSIAVGCFWKCKISILPKSNQF